MENTAHLGTFFARKKKKKDKTEPESKLGFDANFRFIGDVSDGGMRRSRVGQAVRCSCSKDSRGITTRTGRILC